VAASPRHRVGARLSLVPFPVSRTEAHVSLESLVRQATTGGATATGVGAAASERISAAVLSAASAVSNMFLTAFDVSQNLPVPTPAQKKKSVAAANALTYYRPAMPFGIKKKYFRGPF